MSLKVILEVSKLRKLPHSQKKKNARKGNAKTPVDILGPFPTASKGREETDFHHIFPLQLVYVIKTSKFIQS